MVDILQNEGALYPYRARRITRATPKRILFFDGHTGNTKSGSFLRACDKLFSLPAKENAISWTWCALAMGFYPCASRKKPFHGLGVRLRCAFPTACPGNGLLMHLAGMLAMDFPPACQGKGHLMDLVCACGRLSQEARDAPRSARGAPEAKTCNYC